jgi:acyl carrier protein
MGSTFETIRNLMVNEFQLDASTILPDTPLVDLGVDSLAALEFGFALEEAFAVTLDPRTDLRAARVSDVVAAVDAARADAAAESALG